MMISENANLGRLLQGAAIFHQTKGAIQQAIMATTFAAAYQALEKSLHGFSPAEEPWFLPALYARIEQFGEDTAIDYALQSNWPIYHLELFIKAGIRDINKSLLLPYLSAQTEDDVYSAALCLAICGFDDGFDVLAQFAKFEHELSKHIDPLVDILPDLLFIDNPRVKVLEQYCISQLKPINDCLQHNDENDILLALMPYLEAKRLLTEAEKTALKDFEAYNKNLIGLIGLLIDNMPRILIGKVCDNQFIRNKCIVVPHTLADIETIADVYLEQPHSYAEYYVYTAVMNLYSRDKVDEHGRLRK